MRTTRVYTAQPLAVAHAARQLVRLEPMGSAHLIKVLRKRAGAQITLFNGDGIDYTAEIEIPKPEAVELRVIKRSPNTIESPLKITLLQALCRGDKMDWILEKATELGVHRVIPIQTERTEVQLDAERAQKRLSHWQRVIISACEQCGRAQIPEISPIQDLDVQLASQLQAGIGLVLEPSALGFQSLIARIEPTKNISELRIAIGPEGGFSERDLAQFAAANFESVSFGNRILRTETAGIAAIAVLQNLWGDMK